MSRVVGLIVSRQIVLACPSDYLEEMAPTGELQVTVTVCMM